MMCQPFPHSATSYIHREELEVKSALKLFQPAYELQLMMCVCVCVCVSVYIYIYIDRLDLDIYS